MTGISQFFNFLIHSGLLYSDTNLRDSDNELIAQYVFVLSTFIISLYLSVLIVSYILSCISFLSFLVNLFQLSNNLFLILLNSGSNIAKRSQALIAHSFGVIQSSFETSFRFGSTSLLPSNTIAHSNHLTNLPVFLTSLYQ